ncbi:DUF4180 domain-containing protein [Flavobacterium humi]|nr:DUF4180 domain-containing protein [Flavobacterium humi]
MAEVISENTVIGSIEDGLDILGDLYYQGFDAIILYEKNITPLFFDLKNRMAGEILQKFSNYRMRLSIIGDYGKYERKSVQDFIFESNKTGHVTFVNTLQEALNRFSA